MKTRLLPLLVLLSLACVQPTAFLTPSKADPQLQADAERMFTKPILWLGDSSVRAEKTPGYSVAWCSLPGADASVYRPMLQWAADTGLLTRRHTVILCVNPHNPEWNGIDVHNELVEMFAATFGHEPSNVFLEDLTACVDVCASVGCRLILYVTPQEPEVDRAFIRERVEMIRQAVGDAELLDLTDLCTDSEFAHDADVPTSHLTPAGRARVRDAVLAAVGR